MNSPRAARSILRFVAPRHREDDVVGDFEEAHSARVERWGPARAWFLSHAEAIDVALSLLRSRLRRDVPTPTGPSESAKGDLLEGAGMSWLDFKLGLRMLAKYPGLTIISSIAIAFAITLGAGTYEFFIDLTSPTMPFQDGDRIVTLRNRDIALGEVDSRALHDFETWRAELRTVEEVGAYRPFRRNLITERGGASPIIGAEVTSAMLGLPRVPPALGRLLSEVDEVPGAPNVILIGYDVWRARFGSDPEVVGTTVRLGAEQATVVGVMPEGFEWPSAHSAWTPLRLNPLDYARGESPGIGVVGRLAPTAGMAKAHAELSAIAARNAADYPESHATLRPEIIRYGKIEFPVTGVTFGLFYSLGVAAFIALMALVCGNVALLLFARTAAREGEIVVRSALGASRGRIISQLLAEALVLGALATVLGLWGADRGVTLVVETLRETGDSQLFGFWTGGGLSPSTVVFATLFTLISTSVAGLIPALKVTGTGVGSHLRRASAGAGLEFGRLWTTVIVSQIAVTVAFVPIILVLGAQTLQVRTAAYGFAAEEYLAVELAMGTASSGTLRTATAGSAHENVDALRAASQELVRRLNEDPAVRAVTTASQIPGAYHPGRVVDMEGPAAPRTNPWGFRVGSVTVDTEYFRTLGVQIISGRDLRTADGEGGLNVVVVNEDFVHDVLEDRNPIGRRFALREYQEDPDAAATGPWYEIVGVSEQIAMTIDPEDESSPGIYFPLGPEPVQPLRLAIHLGEDPARFAARVRELASEVDPNLLLTDIRSLDDSAWEAEVTYNTWFWIVLAAGGIGLILATAGIYSIMAFTVSRRTREIGVRVALGGNPRRIIWGVFSRALKQIGMGITTGGILIAAFMILADGTGIFVATEYVGLFAIYLVVMSLVCGLACIVPTARALSVEPTEALRAEN